jgi:hypothetical protein
MESRVISVATSILRVMRRQVTKVTLDVSNDVFRPIAHEGAEFYVGTTLVKKAVSSDAGHASSNHTGVLVFGKKRF